MNKLKTPEDIKVNVKLKLAALWASFMCLYIYVDHLHLYMPDTLKNIQNGIVFEFGITQGFLVIAMVSMTLPALMIFLSTAMPAKINRRVNIIVATVYIPYMLFNLVGVVWIHMAFAAIAEVILLCLVIRYAWKWPLVEA